MIVEEILAGESRNAEYKVSRPDKSIKYMKTVIVAEIAAGKQRPYYIKSEGVTSGVYIRVAGTTRPADRTGYISVQDSVRHV